MKRFVLTILYFAGASIITAGVVVHAATVVGTRHDLSSPSAFPAGTGPGPIRSSPSDATSEVCVFCHTPHNAGSIADAPLWNKNLNAAEPTYTMYTSDVLGTQGLNYSAAEQPVVSGKTVHLRNTRLCLTCHDGTIALGNLANLPPGYAGDVQMTYVGKGTITTMPTYAEGFLDVDLSDDHPVSIPYMNAQDPELSGSIPVVPPVVSGVKIYPDGVSTNYVECTSCHNPHDNTNPPFLVATNQNSGLCTTCHSAKAGFTNSIHDTSSVGYQPPDGPGGLPDIGTNVGLVKCMNCHYPHKAGVNVTTDLPLATANPGMGKYLMALQEEMSCYNDKNRWGQSGLTACHNSSSGGKDIKTEVETVSGIRHRVNNYAGNHQATEYRNTGMPGNAYYNWVNLSGIPWHVECDDCHNSHTAKNTNHTRGLVNGNAVGANSPLKGAGGVSVNVWPGWGPPATSGTYTYIEPEGLITTAASNLQYEYQVCIKCHSDFAWNNLPPAASTGGFGNLTNQSLEFGGNSVAYHPVVNNTTAAGHQPATPQGTYSAPWTANAGNQTMYCSDCHTKQLDGSPTGPHGSTNSFILREPYSDTYSGKGSDQSTADLCFQCHPSATYFSGAGTVTGFSGGGVNLHTQHQFHANNSGISTRGYKCVNCHTRVPHGWWRKGMIIVQGEGALYGAQYEAGGAGAGLITTFVVPASGNYQVGLLNKNQNCTTVPGCH